MSLDTNQDITLYLIKGVWSVTVSETSLIFDDFNDLEEYCQIVCRMSLHLSLSQNQIVIRNRTHIIDQDLQAKSYRVTSS